MKTVGAAPWAGWLLKSLQITWLRALLAAWKLGTLACGMRKRHEIIHMYTWYLNVG